MSDVFKEVDEELRRERWMALWKAYGAYLVAAAVGVVLMVGGRSFWIDYVDRTRKAESLAYDQALAQFQLDPATGRSAMEAVTGSANEGYSALARFQLADQLRKSGQNEQAVAVYEKILAAGGPNERLSGLAGLMVASLYIDLEREVDAREVLMGIVADSSTWKYSATEMLGFLDLRAGSRTAALAIFTSLATDVNVPQGIKTRAGEMLILIESADGSTLKKKDPEPAAKENPAKETPETSGP